MHPFPHRVEILIRKVVTLQDQHAAIDKLLRIARLEENLGPGYRMLFTGSTEINVEIDAVISDRTIRIGDCEFLAKRQESPARAAASSKILERNLRHVS